MTPAGELEGPINIGGNRSPDLEAVSLRRTHEASTKTRPKRNAARPNKFEGFETDWKDEA